MLLALVPMRAAGAPYAALRPQDSVLAGPTDGTVAALHYNPAALRLSRGFRIEVQLNLQGFVGHYQRLAPLPAGFAPGSAASPAPATPIRWVVPGYLIGGLWDLGTETVTLGAAVSTPYHDGTLYAPEDEAALQHLPTRYHAIRNSAYTLWGTTGVGVRIQPWLHVGGGFHFAWMRLRRHLLRDPDPDHPDGLPCGDPMRCEQWAARQQVRLDLSEWGFGFSVGMLLVPDERHLWLGASFTSTSYLRGGTVSGQPPAEAPPCMAEPLPAWQGVQAAAGNQVCHGAAALATSLPHLVHLGGRLRLPGATGRHRPAHLELTALLRLAIPPRQDDELHLERRALVPLALPPSQIVATGEQTAVAAELGLRQLWPRLQLGQAVLYESPRARIEAITPAAIHGHRLDLSATVRASLHRAVQLLLTAGTTFVLVPEGAGARFAAETAAACRAAAYDPTSAACREAQDGWAQPPAAGRYELAIPHGAAGIEVTL